MTRPRMTKPRYDYIIYLEIDQKRIHFKREFISKFDQKILQLSEFVIRVNMGHYKNRICLKKNSDIFLPCVFTLSLW